MFQSSNQFPKFPDSSQILSSRNDIHEAVLIFHFTRSYIILESGTIYFIKLFQGSHLDVHTATVREIVGNIVSMNLKFGIRSFNRFEKPSGGCQDGPVKDKLAFTTSQLTCVDLKPRLSAPIFKYNVLNTWSCSTYTACQTAFNKRKTVCAV